MYSGAGDYEQNDSDIIQKKSYRLQYDSLSHVLYCVIMA
jgi:hypothetical protein